MSKFDVEQFVKNVVTVLKANLNAKILEIDTEKGDFTLDQIPAEAWFFNLYPKDSAFKVFIIYGILSEPNLDSIEGAALREVTIQLEVGLPDRNWKETESGAYRILRYRRALEEVVSNNFRKFGNGKKPLVIALSPASLKYKGSMTNFAGINISINLDT